tara:strand:- start:1650 stop:2114 length:465 start_codon:yes stop_codon:yes gene_type:complete
MEKFQTRLILLISVLILFSCAKPEVVQVIKPGDEQMNCKELEKEVAEVQKFKRDAQWEKDKEGANFARAVLFWPAMATTFANAEKAIKAAEDRSFHLIKIMDKKKCKGVDIVKAEINKFATNSVVEQLKAVKKMYKSGDLSKEEYIKAKKKILD